MLLVGALLFVAQPAKADGGGPRLPSRRVVIEVNLDLRRPAICQRAPLGACIASWWSGCAALPGVVSAAQVGLTPMSGSGWNEMVHPDDKPAVREEVNFNRVGPGLFQDHGDSPAWRGANSIPATR